MTYFISGDAPTVLLMNNHILELDGTWVPGTNLPPALIENGYRSVEILNEPVPFEVNDDGTVTRWALGDPKFEAANSRWVMEYESYREEWHDPVNDEILGMPLEVEEKSDETG